MTEIEKKLDRAVRYVGRILHMTFTETLASSSKHPRRHKKGSFRDAVDFVAAFMLAVFSSTAVVVLIQTIAGSLLHTRDSATAASLLLGVIVASAIFAFWLRTHHRIFYGLVEFWFGVIYGYYGLRGVKVDAPYLSLLIAWGGSLYLMVRALDNVREGLKKREESRVEAVTVPLPTGGAT